MGEKRGGIREVMRRSGRACDEDVKISRGMGRMRNE
jgi:hypothetical protein